MTDLRTLENDSIRAFVQSAADEGYLSGRVLDYGCGKQPYRDIVEAAGEEYVGFDDPEYPANTSGERVGAGWSERLPYDTVLCTQVIQYVPGPALWVDEVRRLLLHSGGHLVLSYPTNWPEVEREDLHRFTKAGMERLLTEAGFTIVRHERRATVNALWGSGRNSGYTREELALGYGVICRA